MLKKYIYSLVMLLISGFCMHASETGFSEDNQLFLVANSAGGDTVNAIRVTKDMTMTFSGDSIIFSGEGRRTVADKNIVSSFSYSSECVSPFTVKITGNLEEHPSIQGATVILMKEDMPDYDGFVKISDSNGLSTFPNLPYGKYSVTVIDPEEAFIDISSICIFHGYNDENEIFLDENLISPHSLFSELYELEDGTNEVKIGWMMNEDVSDGEFRGYLFHITLDGEYQGETYNKYFIISDPLPGYHTIDLQAISPFGTPTDHLIFHFEVPGFTTGIEIIGEECVSSERFFDINGVPVDKENLVPGIYVRTDGKNHKKILIR